MSADVHGATSGNTQTSGWATWLRADGRGVRGEKMLSIVPLPSLLVLAAGLAVALVRRLEQTEGLGVAPALEILVQQAVEYRTSR
jgi:hypothetical protein